MSSYVITPPWQIRWHVWRTGHLLTTYNPFITVPMGDFSKGVYAKCDCGKSWAL